MHIKKGDNVIVIAGKDKGKTGKVEKVIKGNRKLIVSRLNLSKFHQRPKRTDQKGQIVEKVMPIHVSNVMVVDPKSNKLTRIGVKFVNGEKKRITKRSQTILD